MAGSISRAAAAYCLTPAFSYCLRAEVERGLRFRRRLSYGDGVRRPNHKVLFNGQPQIWLGVNFWSRTGGPLMWRYYDPKVAREELDAMKSHGMTLTLRHPGHGRMVSATVVPKDRSQLFRERIKQLFAKNTTSQSLQNRLRKLNPMLRGWANYYRHAWGAKKVFDGLDHHVWWTIARWLKKKHRTSLLQLGSRYGWRKPGGRALRWRDGEIHLFEMSSVPVEQYKLGWIDNYFA